MKKGRDIGKCGLMRIDVRDLNYQRCSSIGSGRLPAKCNVDGDQLNHENDGDGDDDVARKKKKVNNRNKKLTEQHPNPSQFIILLGVREGQESRPSNTNSRHERYLIRRRHHSEINELDHRPEHIIGLQRRDINVAQFLL